MISIIVPVYKAEMLVARCIDSILVQSYKDWELIIVDDGSPDKSGKICDEYAHIDSRIIVIHKQNGGVSSARNIGIEKARGEWIAFVDSDDWVESDWLQCVVDKQNEVVADMYTWGNTKDTPYGKIFDTYIPKDVVFNKGVDFISSKYYKHGMVWYLFKREWIEKYNCRCPKGIRRSEDQCFNLKYLCHNPKIVTIPKAFYHYVDNPVSCINQKVDANDLADNLRVAVMFASYAENYNEIDLGFVKIATYRLFYNYLDYINRNHLMFDDNAHKLYLMSYNELKSINESLCCDFGFKVAEFSLKWGLFTLNHINGIKSRLHIS